MESSRSSLKNWFKKSGHEALALAARLALIILAAVVAGILLLLLYMQNTTINRVVFDLTASICIGLLVGFLARFILRKSTPTLRFLVAAVALFAGLMVMNLISNGALGLSPYVRSAIDWYGLVQIGLGLGSAYVAQMGFRRKPVPEVSDLSDYSPPDAPLQAQSYISSPAAVSALAPAAPKTRKSAAKKSKTSSKKETGKTQVVVAKKMPLQPAKAARRSRKKVTLAAFDEHRCPYCLEEVKRNDPRGVVICPICKAYHHKDCWDITGRCQVPHDNPL